MSTASDTIVMRRFHSRTTLRVPEFAEQPTRHSEVIEEQTHETDVEDLLFPAADTRICSMNDIIGFVSDRDASTLEHSMVDESLWQLVQAAPLASSPLDTTSQAALDTAPQEALETAPQAAVIPPTTLESPRAMLKSDVGEQRDLSELALISIGLTLMTFVLLSVALTS
jgi:hypothetical protein